MRLVPDPGNARRAGDGPLHRLRGGARSLMRQFFPIYPPPREVLPEEEVLDQLCSLYFDVPGTDGAAARRALRLMYRVLSPPQRWEFLRRGCFTVVAPGWGRFQVLPRSIFNVMSLESGTAYCVTTLVPVPVPDLMLADKLLLENDPDWFFVIANRRQPDGGRICWPGG